MLLTLGLPAGATLFFSFNAGGYFAGSPALGAVVLGVALVLRITTAQEPFAGFNPVLALAAGALGLFAAWALVSTLWSDAPARAMIEFDRALLYWFALVLTGSFVRTTEGVAWGLRGLAVATFVVCVAGLLTRLVPDVFEVARGFSSERLSYPLTYWNAVGLMAALGVVLALHLASGDREPVAARAFGAAALPLTAVTLLLSFSRGSIVVAVLGVAAYALFARPRGLLSAALSAGLPTAVALAAAYRADLLAVPDPPAAEAIAQGHRLALVLLISMAAAAGARVLAGRLDRRLERIRLGPGMARRAGIVATVVTLATVVVVSVVLDLPDRIGDQYDRFVRPDVVSGDGDVRSRLVDPGNNGRLDHWKVALQGFERNPVTGLGAGTYPALWAELRDNPRLKVEDAHSLYIELLAEVGIVGFALLLASLGTILVAVARRMRREDRQVYGAVLAAGITWAVHAGLDWDWEMPAVTIWFFALGGLALSSREGANRFPVPGRSTRVALGVGCLTLLVTPVLMAVSQRSLNAAADAFENGRCAQVVAHALDSIAVLGTRPEPFELIGYCDVRLGQPELAIRLMRGAVDRDPANWRSWYGLALVRASSGRDPRPATRRALKLNPLEPLVRDAARAFRGEDPEKWRRRAVEARLPL